MAKSRKGKQAIENMLVLQFEKLINEKFEKCPFDKRTEMFEELEKWAYKELNEECCEIFIKALHNAQITQDIQISIGLEKALKKIMAK